LTLGCLQSIAQFGIAQVGPWTLDLEELGIDWLERPDKSGGKVAYSQATVDLFRSRRAHRQRGWLRSVTDRSSFGRIRRGRRRADGRA